MLLNTLASLNVTISQDFNGTLYPGTPLAIVCSLNLTSTEYANVSFNVTNIWSKNGNALPNNSRIKECLTNTSSTFYDAILYFYPLHNSTDSGEYSCSLIVSASGMENAIGTASVDITVNGNQIFQ